MVISHDLGTARRIADFIAVLWKGKIVESGPSEELFNSDNEFVASSSTRRPPARWRWTERPRGRSSAAALPPASATFRTADGGTGYSRLRPGATSYLPACANLFAAACRCGRASSGRCRSSSRPSSLALIGAVAALRLEPDAGTDSLVDSDSPPTRRPRTSSSKFGDDAVVVLVKGDLDQLVLNADLDKLLVARGLPLGQVEGGKVFTDKPAPAPCATIAAAKPAQAVLGAATFLNQSAIQATSSCAQGSSRRSSRAGGGARAAARARRRANSAPSSSRRRSSRANEVIGSSSSGFAARGPGTGRPGCRASTTRPSSARSSSTRGAGEPKARFLALRRARRRADPRPAAARAERVRARRGDRADPRRGRRPRTSRSAVRELRGERRAGRRRRARRQALERDLRPARGALAVMTITLALVFGPPLRLLPLAVALGAAAIAFGPAGRSAAR